MKQHRLSSAQSLALALGGTALGAGLSRGLAPQPTHGATKTWYDKLEKPAFQPPKKVFGPMWMALYACTAIGAWRLLKAAPSADRSKALTLWTAHLGLNAIWSRLFFKEKKGRASLTDSAAYFIDAAALTYYAGKVDKTSGALFAPLAGWLALATSVNEEVVRKNPQAFRDTRR